MYLPGRVKRPVASITQQLACPLSFDRRDFINCTEDDGKTDDQLLERMSTGLAGRAVQPPRGGLVGQQDRRLEAALDPDGEFGRPDDLRADGGHLLELPHAAARGRIVPAPAVRRVRLYP